jgi:hypothetical protein
MTKRKRETQNPEERLERVMDEAEEEAPEAEHERSGDRARHLTPGVGWTRGKDIEDHGSQKKAPHQPHTALDRTGEKKYERGAKKSASRGNR